MTIERRKSTGLFRVLSLKMEKKLEEALKSLQLEGCRHVWEVASYLLDVESAASEEDSTLPILTKGHNTSDLAGYVKLQLPASLYSRLLQQADSYGLGLPEVIRVFLWRGVRHHRKLVPKGTMVQKEEFVRLIMREPKKLSRLENIRQGLKLIWSALTRRY